MGTNDVGSDRPSDLTAKSIVDVVSSMKNEKHNVGVPNIISQTDRVKVKAN